MPITFISRSRTILSIAALHPHQELPVDGVAPASQKIIEDRADLRLLHSTASGLLAEHIDGTDHQLLLVRRTGSPL